MNELDILEQEYNKAVENNETSFSFNGKEVLTTYAKYLIDYLKDDLG